MTKPVFGKCILDSRKKDEYDQTGKARGLAVHEMANVELNDLARFFAQVRRTTRLCGNLPVHDR